MFYRSLAVTGLLLVQIGCSSDSGNDHPSDNERYLGLDTPSDGFQLRSVGATIPAGGDEEYCEVAELPGNEGEPIFVRATEMANGKGSHHLIIAVAPPGGKADRKLRSLNVGDRVPCVSAQMAFGEDIQAIGGIQHPYGKAQYPEGMALQFYGKQRLVFDYHYFNASREPVEARSAINFHRVDSSEVKQLVGLFGFSNWTIDTPAHQKGSFKADCRVGHDITVQGLTRHTHQWGRDFSAWHAGGAKDGELIWTTPNYDTNTDHAFDPALPVKAGEGFAFECTYDNTEDRRLRFGVNATDEMCILFGSYWDAHGAYQPPGETCDITWVDAGGVGHSAYSNGGFPTPSAGEVSACLAGAGAAASDPCTQCNCNACASILVKCFTDADCGPIAQCRAPSDCEPVIDQHSSGVGLAQQVGACVQSKCAAACAH